MQGFLKKKSWLEREGVNKYFFVKFYPILTYKKELQMFLQKMFFLWP